MKIIVSTHQGVVLNEETEYILVHNSDGEFGILTNHIPVVTIIDNGYIKTTNKNAIKYVSLCGAIFEFHNNEAVILAQELSKIGVDALIIQDMGLLNELIKTKSKISPSYQM